MKKKSIDLNNIPDNQREDFERLNKQDQARNIGIGCDVKKEKIPSYNKAPCEIVWNGDNNSWIVFGRDRSGPRYVSGSYDNGKNLGPYGPKGHDNCGMIDFVVGRFSNRNIEGVVEPDFFQDAARIYISQKTDIDSNFKIKSEKKQEGKSAIGLKADSLRLIARENIKLVTGTDNKNSLNGNIYKIEGIDLQAGNLESELQPMNLGENTKQVLEKIIKQIDSLNGILDAFLTYQMRFNEAVTNHTHISPFYALSTTPSETLMIEGRSTSIQMNSDVKTSLYGNKINLVSVKQTYLKPYGNKYILSKYNRTN